jgi:hypothetical protein
MSQRLKRGLSMRIIFVLFYSLFLNASSTFFHCKSASTAPASSDGVSAISYSKPQRGTVAFAGPASMNSLVMNNITKNPTTKRNPHNLYRIIRRLGSILKNLTCTVGNLLLHKRHPKEVVVENRISSLFTQYSDEKVPKNRLSLQSVNSFFVKKFPRKDIMNGPKAAMISFPNIFGRILSENNNQTSKKQYNLFARRVSKNSPAKAVFLTPHSWGGISVTEKERLALIFLDEKRTSVDSIHGLSPWLKTATGTDFLRFLRVKNGDQNEAWNMIYAHAKWRVTKLGADSILRNKDFEDSVLHRELFWLGVNAEDHPTLVIRTQAHDGADYNEDPKIFTR